jgi:hypothetical protein
MVYEIDTLDISLLAAGNLSTYQYRFVKLSANNTVTICGNTEQALGVLQNKPSAAGEAARVRIFGVSRLAAHDNSLTYGVLVGSQAVGRGVAVSADKAMFHGVVLYGATAQDELASVLLAGVNTISA